MATFKPDIQYKRADGTYNVCIRVTHNREIRRISTNIYITQVDLTKSMKIKNQNYTDQINALTSKCRYICDEIGFPLANMSIDDLVERLKLKLKGGDKFKLDFIKFPRRNREIKKSTALFYTSAINVLKRGIGKFI